MSRHWPSGAATTANERDHVAVAHESCCAVAAHWTSMSHVTVLGSVQLLSDSAQLCFDELKCRLAFLPTKLLTPPTIHTVQKTSYVDYVIGIALS